MLFSRRSSWCVFVLVVCSLQFVDVDSRGHPRRHRRQYHQDLRRVQQQQQYHERRYNSVDVQATTTTKPDVELREGM